MRSGSTYEDVRHVIQNLAPGQLFTTQEFLWVAERSSLDKSLTRLCNAGVITRVAHGVYVKGADCDHVSIREIVQAKARRFGKLVWELEKAPGRGIGDEVAFATNGPSSSLIVKGKRVRLVHVSLRKHPQAEILLATPVSNFVYNLVQNS